MSEATLAIAKLRTNKPNPNYRPLIFVVAPFTEVVKKDPVIVHKVQSTANLSINMAAFPFVHSFTYLNLLTCTIHRNFK